MGSGPSAPPKIFTVSATLLLGLLPLSDDDDDDDVGGDDDDGGDGGDVGDDGEQLYLQLAPVSSAPCGDESPEIFTL